MFEAEEGGDLRELARRLAMTYGAEAGKHQQSVLNLHREGIVYALALPAAAEESETVDEPPNLHFLEVLKEFVSRLTAKVGFFLFHLISSFLTW